MNQRRQYFASPEAKGGTAFEAPVHGEGGLWPGAGDLYYIESKLVSH
jgi:hypothetical protein